MSAWERLRYNRVKNAQLKGEVVREMWHSVDWSKVRGNPDLVKLPREPWLLSHDAEAHTVQTWAAVVNELENGGEKLTDGDLAAAQAVERPITPPSGV